MFPKDSEWVHVVNTMPLVTFVFQAENCGEIVNLREVCGTGWRGKIGGTYRWGHVSS